MPLPTLAAPDILRPRHAKVGARSIRLETGTNEHRLNAPNSLQSIGAGATASTMEWEAFLDLIRVQPGLKTKGAIF